MKLKGDLRRTMIDSGKLTIKEAADLIAKKQIKVFELAQIFLERAKKLNKKLNSYITITENVALQQAKKVDELIADNQKLPPLAGIPIAIKDLFSTKGIKTTAGSKVLEDYIPVYDATVISRLKEVNSVFIGKTNQDAWGHGSSGENSDFGPTKNPWDTTRVPGGSSSGSAVAVVTQDVEVATGTDTCGSIRLPSNYTNICGLKPTYGALSRYGVIAFASSLDCPGLFARSVAKLKTVFSQVAGFDPKDTTTPRQARNKAENKKIRTIGLPREFFTQGLNSEIKNLIQAAAKRLEKKC